MHERENEIGIGRLVRGRRIAGYGASNLYPHGQSAKPCAMI